LVWQTPKTNKEGTTHPRMVHRTQRVVGGRSISIARGEESVCRGSIFTAQVAWPCKTVAEANAAIACMRQEGCCSAADHNMSAYRICGRKIEKAYDDDGEARGGQRLLGALTKAGATDVAVIVSRVYGGENIGKRRFEIIAERASALLHELGHVAGVGISHEWGSGQILGDSAEAASSSNGNAAVVGLARAGGAATGAAVGGAGGSSGKKRKRDAAAEAEEQRRQQREAAAAAAERRLSLSASK
jgi:hypothetical protein